MKFSERMGITPVRTALQIDTMDQPLRNGLWNALDVFIWRQSAQDLFGDLIIARQFTIIFELLWASHFGRTLDTLPYRWHEAIKKIKEYFFSASWHEVYDLIEFMARVPDPPFDTTGFINFCNTILETEKSGYRFIGEQIAPITSEEEISAISDAISGAQASGLSAVAAHLQDALAKLSDRKKPDYRNSIKESISAVEAIARSIAGDPKAEFSKALRVIEDKIGLHGALKAGFLKLYGYTSDEGGIRHPLLDVPNVDFDDAKFMLVSCSAFVNYLIAKCQKAGIKLK